MAIDLSGLTRTSISLAEARKFNRSEPGGWRYAKVEKPLNRFLADKTDPSKGKALTEVVNSIGAWIDVFEKQQPRVLQFAEARELVENIGLLSNPPTDATPEDTAGIEAMSRYDLKRLCQARDVYHWLTVGLDEIRKLEAGVHLSSQELSYLGLLGKNLDNAKDFKPEVIQTLVADRKRLGLAQDKGCTPEELAVKIEEDILRKNSYGSRLCYYLALFSQIRDEPNADENKPRANTLTGRNTSMSFLRYHKDKLNSGLIVMGKNLIKFYDEINDVAQRHRLCDMSEKQIPKVTAVRSNLEALKLKPRQHAGYSFSDLKEIVVEIGETLSKAVDNFQYVPPQKPEQAAAEGKTGTVSSPEDDDIAREHKALTRDANQLLYGEKATDDELSDAVDRRLTRLADLIVASGADVSEDASNYRSHAKAVITGLTEINQSLEGFVQKLVNEPSDFLREGFIITKEHALALEKDLAEQEKKIAELSGKGNLSQEQEEELSKAQTEKKSIRHLFAYRAHSMIAQLYRAKRWYGVLKEIREVSDPSKQEMLNNKIAGLFKRYTWLVEHLNEGRTKDDRLEFLIADESRVRQLALYMYTNTGVEKCRQDFERELELVYDIVSVCEALADPRKKTIDRLRMQQRGEQEILKLENRRYIADYIEKEISEETLGRAAGYIEDDKAEKMLRPHLVRAWKQARYGEHEGATKLSDDIVIESIKRDLLTPNIDEPGVKGRILEYTVQVFRHAIDKYIRLGQNVCDSWRGLGEYQAEKAKLDKAFSSLTEALRAPTADAPHTPTVGDVK